MEWHFRHWLVETSLFSSILLTVSKEIKPIFAKLDQLLLETVMLLAWECSLVQPLAKQLRENGSRQNRILPTGLSPWRQLVMQSTSWAECRGSNTAPLLSWYAVTTFLESKAQVSINDCENTELCSCEFTLFGGLTVPRNK